ncbi:hypothetical protein GCM10010885_10420 [Alicyclobacillus cellulosilyticus]|uniref:Bifunctional DNA primase/polymerase-like protein n=1 Tax=Alicyclobacillus cellulosilyticus TaxID=1003997 RepID=A0A917NJS5_9BACL|nr:bifunctional DNA primase/polymerase [Alicyclobacillus cellulosilyticus]GGJ03049.1 hypothetical protein GCM10010885_10420 [Alicyclobacillus cellulosilyticus]
MKHDTTFLPAVQYAQRGLSVIPVEPRGKRPLLQWRPFQTHAPTPEQVERWARQWPECNWAIVTGAVSGVVVLDLDSPEAVHEAKRRGLPRAPVVFTGKGYHLYFAHPGYNVANTVRVLPGADIRADGGYVVVPPSVHPSGHVYAWIRGRSILDLNPPPMPEWLHALLSAPVSALHTPQHDTMTDLERIALGVDEGERNQAAARLAGYLLKYLPHPRVAVALMEAWNLTNRPPLPWQELQRTINSIARREARKEASA